MGWQTRQAITVINACRWFCSVNFNFTFILGPASNSQQPPGYSTIPHGGPASNAPALSAQTSNMAPGGPASNAPMSQGPPSNAPASQGPPSNAPPSVQGPPSNAPINTSNHSPGTTELPSDISDLVNNASTDNVSTIYNHARYPQHLH